MKLVLIFFNQQFLMNRNDCAIASLSILTRFPNFVRLFLVSKIKNSSHGFKDLRDRERNTIAWCHIISEEEFQRRFDQWTDIAISVLNANGTLWQKINVFFIVQFCLGKKSLSHRYFMNTPLICDEWLAGWLVVLQHVNQCFFYAVVSLPIMNSNYLCNKWFFHKKLKKLTQIDLFDS